MAARRMGGGNFAAVAVSMGIARHEISQLTGVAHAFSNYPKLESQPLPLEPCTEIAYLADVSQELTQRFHEAAFYDPILGASTSATKDVRRYTDKYREQQKQTYTPAWHRLPAELQWGKRPAPKSDASGTAVKKARLNVATKNIDSKLDELEAAESKQEGEVSPTKETKKKEDEKSDGEEDKEAELSDEDYLEEGNDYIESYFDNGEDYGELDSGDNLDNDEI